MDTRESGVGILGLGAYLPPIVRTNDHWPERIVAGWRAKQADKLARGPIDLADASPAVRAVAAAMAEAAQDPFQGARERRVMPDDMLPSDMELRAAKDAIARADVDPTQIDLVIGFSMTPDVLNVPNACRLHDELGLSERCFSIALDTVCNSFQSQMALAEAMIKTGRARYALLFQSTALSRLARLEDAFSVSFGDGATAQIVGPVAAGRGLIGSAHGTDGTLRNALATGIPGKHWWEDGRIVSYLPDPASAFRMLVTVAETGQKIAARALADAGVAAGDIDFFACHQASSWFRAVAQAELGLLRARAVDTFSWAGSLSGANIPLVLATADRDGMLKPGDLILTYAGGTGITYSSLVVRWGR